MAVYTHFDHGRLTFGNKLPFWEITVQYFSKLKQTKSFSRTRQFLSNLFVSHELSSICGGLVRNTPVCTFVEKSKDPTTSTADLTIGNIGSSGMFELEVFMTILSIF